MEVKGRPNREGLTEGQVRSSEDKEAARMQQLEFDSKTTFQSRGNMTRRSFVPPSKHVGDPAKYCFGFFFSFRIFPGAGRTEYVGICKIPWICFTSPSGRESTECVEKGGAKLLGED